MVSFPVLEKKIIGLKIYGRLWTSSLRNMNKTEPKIKLSGLPLFQSCQLEYTLIKLFRYVLLSDLFLGLSDP